MDAESRLLLTRPVNNRPRGCQNAAAHRRQALCIPHEPVYLKQKIPNETKILIYPSFRNLRCLGCLLFNLLRFLLFDLLYAQARILNRR